jgi:hypothetical protein
VGWIVIDVVIFGIILFYRTCCRSGRWS